MAKAYYKTPFHVTVLILMLYFAQGGCGARTGNEAGSSVDSVVSHYFSAEDENMIEIDITETDDEMDEDRRPRLIFCTWNIENFGEGFINRYGHEVKWKDLVEVGSSSQQ